MHLSPKSGVWTVLRGEEEEVRTEALRRKSGFSGLPWKESGMEWVKRFWWSWRMSCCFSETLEILWLHHILEAKQLLCPMSAKMGLEKEELSAPKSL